MNRGQKAAGQIINNRVAQQKGQMPAMQQMQSDPQLSPMQMEQEEGV